MVVKELESAAGERENEPAEFAAAAAAVAAVVATDAGAATGVPAGEFPESQTVH